MAREKRKATTDAVAILHRRFVDDNPAMQELIAAERANARIAQAIYDLRKKMGLSQRAFAQRIGTTASVICRLENADYEGHSTSMLKQIADACDHRVEMAIRFVPKEAPRHKSRQLV
jgi:ribosome-binding protein aMBF1 (putative translation factor)